MGKDKIKAHGILLVFLFFFIVFVLIFFFPHGLFFGSSRWADGGAEKKLAFSTKTASGKFTFANDDSPHGERIYMRI